MLYLFAGFAFEEQNKVSIASHFVEENPLATHNTVFLLPLLVSITANSLNQHFQTPV